MLKIFLSCTEVNDSKDYILRYLFSVKPTVFPTFIGSKNTYSENYNTTKITIKITITITFCVCDQVHGILNIG